MRFASRLASTASHSDSCKETSGTGLTMKRCMKLLSVAILTCTLASEPAMAQGLSLGRYLADPEHKDDIISFYLNTLLSGISLANERAEPRLFCLDTERAASAYELLDNRIARLQKEKKLAEEMPIDVIIMDMLMDDHPCK